MKHVLTCLLMMVVAFSHASAGGVAPHVDRDGLHAVEAAHHDIHHHLIDNAGDSDRDDAPDPDAVHHIHITADATPFVDLDLAGRTAEPQRYLRADDSVWRSAQVDSPAEPPSA